MSDRCKILTLLMSAAFAWPLMAQSERDGVQLKWSGGTSAGTWASLAAKRGHHARIGTRFREGTPPVFIV
jgi:hypothetical protein